MSFKLFCAANDWHRTFQILLNWQVVAIRWKKNRSRCFTLQPKTKEVNCMSFGQKLTETSNFLRNYSEITFLSSIFSAREEWPYVFRTNKESFILVVLICSHFLCSVAISSLSRGSTEDEYGATFLKKSFDVFVVNLSYLGRFSPPFVRPHWEYILQSCEADAETETRWSRWLSATDWFIMSPCLEKLETFQPLSWQLNVSIVYPDQVRQGSSCSSVWFAGLVMSPSRCL